MRITRQSLAVHRYLILAVLILLLLGSSAGPSSAPRVVPTVRFLPITKLDGYRLEESWGGWSPRAPLLALVGKGGSFVWDASHPESPPVHLPVTGWDRKASWSPAGDRLLFVVGDPNPKNLRVLLAVKANGSSADTLLNGVDCWPVEWEPNASIIYRSGGQLHEIHPLASWNVPAEIRSRSSTVLIHGPDPAFAGLGMCRVSGTPKQETPLSRMNPRLKGDHVLPYDDVLETDRHLILITGRYAAALVIDGAGRILGDVTHTVMYPHSISRDGRLVAGERGILEGGEGDVIADTVYIADTWGKWCVPLSGAHEGGEPQLARTDSLIAFNALHGGVIVGRYQIRSR